MVTDAADPSFRPLELAPFSGRPWRTAQVRGGWWGWDLRGGVCTCMIDRVFATYIHTHTELISVLTDLFFHHTPQTLDVSPVVATAFGICEIHRVKAEDGTVRSMDYTVNTTRRHAPHWPFRTIKLPHTPQHTRRRSRAGSGSTRRTRSTSWRGWPQTNNPTSESSKRGRSSSMLMGKAGGSSFCLSSGSTATRG